MDYSVFDRGGCGLVPRIGCRQVDVCKWVWEIGVGGGGGGLGQLLLLSLLACFGEQWWR